MAIRFGRITDEWRVVIADSDDPGREPDIVAADVHATFTPHIDMIQKTRVSNEQYWTMVLVPLDVIYVEGKLIGEDGDEGLELVSEVDGNPVFWEVERRASFGESVWEPETVTVRPSPGETVHLPTLAPMRKEDLPHVRTVYVDIAAVNAAKNTAESAKRAAEAAKDTAVEKANELKSAASRATSAASRAESAKAAAESAKTAAERATSSKADRAEMLSGLEAKLDKSEIAPGGVDATVNAYAAGKARTIVSRIHDGQIAVQTPTQSYHAANKQYVDSKTWQLTDIQKVGSSGMLTTRGQISGVNYNPEPATIPVRLGAGELTCETGAHPKHAVNNETLKAKVSADVGAARTYVDGKLSERPAVVDVGKGVRVWHKNGMCMLRVSTTNKDEVEQLIKTEKVPEGLRPQWTAIGAVLGGGNLTVGSDGTIKLEGQMHNNSRVYAMVNWLVW